MSCSSNLKFGKLPVRRDDLKFGKLPAEQDGRTIKLKNILKTALPSVPSVFDVDKKLNVTFTESMFANDEWSDCVIAERANQTLRFEYFEQGKQIPITAADCLAEYWKEEGASAKQTNKPDNGLVLLDSLKKWRKTGWHAAGETYKIYAFAALNPTDQTQIKQAIYFLNGVTLGAQIPQSAMDQFDAGQPWTVTSKHPKILGGHCVCLKGFDAEGVTSLTWAREQKITWKWLRKYADEAYTVVQGKSLFVPNSPVDCKKLEDILNDITG